VRSGDGFGTRGVDDSTRQNPKFIFRHDEKIAALITPQRSLLNPLAGAIRKTLTTAAQTTINRFLIGFPLSTRRRNGNSPAPAGRNDAEEEMSSMPAVGHNEV